MIGRTLLMAALLAAAAFPVLVQTTVPVQAQTKTKVVATFSILGDLVAQVGGEDIDLTVLVGPDADTHTYQPRPVDARTVAGARALVSNGLGFEGWADRLVQAAALKGLHIVASAGVTPLPAAAHAHEHAVDPHCWQDVADARRYVATIAAGLASVDPVNASAYRDRAQRYDQRLADLDAWIRAEIATVPPEQRKAITGHDSFRYFTRAYGVRFEAPRGYNPDSDPSARDVAALIRLVREQHIKALFVENMTNPNLVDEIARDSGAVVGPKLYSDALSRPGGPAASYEAMMRHNVTALVAGMRKN
jgi:zinc/manganese transport system substrate-binding protein